MPILKGSIAPSQSVKNQIGSLIVQSPYFAVEQILLRKDLTKRYDYQKLCSEHFPSVAIPPEDYAPELLGTSADSMLVTMA